MRDCQTLARLCQLSRELNLAETRLRTYQLAARFTGELLPADRASIALARNGGKLVIDALSLEDSVIPVGSAIPVENSGLGQVFSSGEPRRWADMSPDLVDQKALAEAGLRSSMSAPLITSEGVIGTLQVARRDPTAFSDTELALFEHIALLIAGALQRAALMESLAAYEARSGHATEALTAMARTARRLARCETRDELRRSSREAATELFGPLTALLWRDRDGGWRELVADRGFAQGEVAQCVRALAAPAPTELHRLGASEDGVLSELSEQGAAVAGLAGFEHGEVAAIAVSGATRELPTGELELLELFCALMRGAAAVLQRP